MAEMQPSADARILKDPVTGELQSVPLHEADARAAAGGMSYASKDEIEQHNFRERRGTPSQVALGLAETATRAATLGAVQSLDNDTEGARERSQYTERNHPVLSAGAQVLPAAAAAIATGGADLPLAGAAAAQGAIAGFGNLTAAQEDAFRNDETLSSEAAWGSFGSGVLLGAATEVGGALLSRGAGAVRDRFIEAATSAGREAEQRAFEGAGIVNPAKDLAKSVKDPVLAASIRGEANEARAAAEPELRSALASADEAHQAVASTVPSGLAIEGDIATQRHLVRDIVVGLRDDLTKMTGADGGIAQQAMDALDRADTQPQIYEMLQRIRGTLSNAADQTDHAGMAEVLQKYSKQAEKLSESKVAWGSPAEDTAAQNMALQQAQQAKANLDGLLSGGDYMQTVGTAAGKPVDDALAQYAERLETVLKGNGSPEAKQGLEALGRVRELTSGDLRKVAAGNQVDALGSTTVASEGAPRGMMGDLLGELGDTVLTHLVPGAGLVRKVFKYRRQIMALVTGANDATERTASAMLSTTASRAAERIAASPLPVALLGAARGAGRTGINASHYFASIDSDPEKAYAKVRGAIEQLSENPEQLMAHLGTQVGDMPHEAPDLFEKVAAQSTRSVEFLKSKIPPAFGFSMLYPDGPPPSRSDILQLSLYWSGATDGKGTLKRIAAGFAMPEEVEAFRYVFPSWFENLQEKTVIKAQDMARKGHVLGAFQIANMETTLDLAGQLDPTFSDHVAQIYQTADAIRVQTQADANASVRPPKAGDRITQKANYS